MEYELICTVVHPHIYNAWGEREGWGQSFSESLETHFCTETFEMGQNKNSHPYFAFVHICTHIHITAVQRDKLSYGLSSPITKTQNSLEHAITKNQETLAPLVVVMEALAAKSLG